MAKFVKSIVTLNVLVAPGSKITGTVSTERVNWKHPPYIGWLGSASVTILLLPEPTTTPPLIHLLLCLCHLDFGMSLLSFHSLFRKDYLLLTV